MENTEQKVEKKFIEVTDEFKKLVWEIGGACLKAYGNDGIDAVLQLYKIVDSARPITQSDKAKK